MSRFLSIFRSVIASQLGDYGFRVEVTGTGRRRQTLCLKIKGAEMIHTVLKQLTV